MAPAQQQARASTQVKEDLSAGQGAEEETWDEERIQQALKVSKEMHIQVRYMCLACCLCYWVAANFSLPRSLTCEAQSFDSLNL